MKTKTRPCGRVSILAGREGFEPSVETSPTTVFETVPFNHSGTFPWSYTCQFKFLRATNNGGDYNL